MLNFEYIVDKLGVTDYPINLPFVYFTVERKDDSFCPPEYVAELQEKYGLLGEYAQLVIKAAEEVYSRPELNAWGWICSSYNKYANIHGNMQGWLRWMSNLGVPIQPPSNCSL